MSSVQSFRPLECLSALSLHLHTVEVAGSNPAVPTTCQSGLVLAPGERSLPLRAQRQGVDEDGR
jgi:hypothetical protein